MFMKLVEIFKEENKDSLAMYNKCMEKLVSINADCKISGSLKN